MDDAFPVHRGEALGDLYCQIEHEVGQKRSAAESLPQRLPRVMPHRDEQAAVLRLADLVDGADIRMVQPGSGLGLLKEPPLHLGILALDVGEELERDAPAEPDVFRPVDNSHPAPAQPFHDTIVRDRPADQITGFGRRVPVVIARPIPGGLGVLQVVQHLVTAIVPDQEGRDHPAELRIAGAGLVETARPLLDRELDDAVEEILDLPPAYRGGRVVGIIHAPHRSGVE